MESQERYCKEVRGQMTQRLDNIEDEQRDQNVRMRIVENCQAGFDEKLNSLINQLKSQTNSLNALIGVIITGLIGFVLYAMQKGLIG